MSTKLLNKQFPNEYELLVKNLTRAYPTVNKEIILDAIQDGLIKCNRRYGCFNLNRKICENKLIDYLRKAKREVKFGINDFPDQIGREDYFNQEPFSLQEMLKQDGPHSLYGKMLNNVITDFVKNDKPKVPKSRYNRRALISTWVYLNLDPQNQIGSKKSQKITIIDLIKYVETNDLCSNIQNSADKEDISYFVVNRLVNEFKEFCKNRIEKYYVSAKLISAETHYCLGVFENIKGSASITKPPSHYSNPFRAIRMNLEGLYEYEDRS